MTISSVSSASAASSATAMSTGISPTQAARLASTAVSLSSDAGVIAFLGGTPSTADSASQLYTALANAGVGTSTSSASASATTGATPAGVGSTSASSVNADWSSILQTNPNLAPFVEQLSAQQALVDTFA